MPAPEANRAGDAFQGPVLEVADLRTHFFTLDGVVKAVDGVSFSVENGETLGIVGESGCGKSITAMSILRLIASPPGRIVGGAIRFQGTNLLELDDVEMQQIRGNQISMIFQEPMTSLNPVLTVGKQISESLMLHRGLSKRAARNEAVEMLKLVNIPVPETRVDEYPHQLSGGMRQRVMIAMALACDPKVLIADEPTTALDVTIQAQILDLMVEIQEKLGTAVILITHDLGVVAENADRVVVMYAGKKVEEANVNELFGSPTHPYTKGLLGSVPRLDVRETAGSRPERLNEIKGIVPSLNRLPPGCAYAPRCPPLPTTSAARPTRRWKKNARGIGRPAGTRKSSARRRHDRGGNQRRHGPPKGHRPQDALSHSQGRSGARHRARLRGRRRFVRDQAGRDLRPGG